jgi:CRP-like cAMP-binding protein
LKALLSHIKTYSALSLTAIADIESAFEELVFSKNEHLITEGKTCKHLYFLQQGAARGYYHLDGKEITHWFAFENDFLTSFHSFITQQPSVENIQFLQGSIVWAITKEKLEILCKTHHEVERILRMAYEKYYIRLEERFVNAQFKTALERYELLFSQTPHILEKASLGHIASYLGISQETLSRIRSRI